MKAALTKITARTLIVAGVLAVAGGAAYARGIEPGITFATQGIDLKIDSIAWYNGAKVKSATWKLKELVPGSDKFWNFNDVKPGDYGCNVISMHVKKADAHLCLDFKNLKQSENGVNEPESHEDGTPGPDLADGTEFFGWIDDGDGEYEPPQEKAIFGTSTQAASHVFGSTTYAIADSRSQSCKMDSARYVGMCWCAGDLKVLPNGDFTCDATALGNEAQTDSFTVDVSIRAEPEKDKKNFKCDLPGQKNYPPPPTSGTCTNCNGPIKVDIKNHSYVTSNTSSSSNTGNNYSGGSQGGNGGGGSGGNGGNSSKNNSSQNNNDRGGRNR